MNAMSKHHNIMIVCHGGRERSASSYHYLSQHAPYDVALRYGASNPKRAGKQTVMGRKMRIIMNEKGYDVPVEPRYATRSTLITKDDAEWASMILYMDDTNYKNLMKVIPEYEHKFKRLSDYNTKSKWIKKGKVPDPGFSEGMDHHREVFDQIEDACSNLLYCLKGES